MRERENERPWERENETQRERDIYIENERERVRKRATMRMRDRDRDRERKRERESEIFSLKKIDSRWIVDKVFYYFYYKYLSINNNILELIFIFLKNIFGNPGFGYPGFLLSSIKFCNHGRYTVI